jgi:hypothetical protein
MTHAPPSAGHSRHRPEPVTGIERHPRRDRPARLASFSSEMRSPCHRSPSLHPQRGRTSHAASASAPPKRRSSSSGCAGPPAGFPGSTARTLPLWTLGAARDSDGCWVLPGSNLYELHASAVNFSPWDVIRSRCDDPPPAMTPYAFVAARSRLPPRPGSHRKEGPPAWLVFYSLGTQAPMAISQQPSS